MTHLIRKPRWIFKRYRSCDPQNDGPLLPRDLLKSYSNSQKKFSSEEQYEFMLLHCAEQNKIPEWCMKPDSPVGFVVADDYVDLVKKGNINPVLGNIDSFTESSVILDDGRSLAFDNVILCTGYDRNLSFLPENLRLKSPLYEDTFPTNSDNIAFIGMYPGARGAVFPLVELQAKLACAVARNEYQLPPPETMQQEITSTPSTRDEVVFSNSLATKLGISPNLNAYDPGFCHVLNDGAYTPARFQLEGKNAQPTMAKKIIEETEYYRRKLLQSKDKIPSLAKMCLFKLKNPVKEKATQEVHNESISSSCS